MGATAAKIFGALVDIMENPDSFLYNFNKIGVEGISVQRQPDALNGVTGSLLEFARRSATELDPYADELDEDEYSGRRHRRRRSRTLDDVIDIIDATDISDSAVDRAIRIYERIVKAYAKAYNKDEETVRLRRTGSRDIISAIVGVCVALDELKPEKVIISTVAVGDGYTHTQRGKMPIPVPEIQHLLDGVPYTAGAETGELCSLCGAAVIAEIADEFGALPEMAIAKSGAGFGRRTFQSGLNCVRSYLGTALVSAASDAYINLSAQIYEMDKDSLAKLGEDISREGIISASVLETIRLDGVKGYTLNVIVSSEKADTVATYILEKTDAKQVIRQIVNAYSK